MNESKEKSLMMQKIKKPEDHKKVGKVKVDARQKPGNCKNKMEIGRMMMDICPPYEGEAIMAIKRELGEF